MAFSTNTYSNQRSKLTSIIGCYLVYLLLLLLIPIYTLAQEYDGSVTKGVIKIQPLKGTIELDGKLIEPIWNQIASFPMTQLAPIYRAEMSEETSIYMTYDAKYVYLAAKNLTKDASTIISNTLQRDDYQANDDIIGVVFDSFNDNEKVLLFLQTPKVFVLVTL